MAPDEHETDVDDVSDVFKVFRALSAVASGLKSGTDNLAQYSDDTNRALSMLVSALTQLKTVLQLHFLRRSSMRHRH